MLSQKFYLFTIFSFLFMGFSGFAQSGLVSGVLKDDSGPIPGAIVMVKGTTNEIVTDFDGNYSINCKVGDILQFSFLGFATKEIIVTAKLFDNQVVIPYTRQIPVENIKTNNYVNALKTVVDSMLSPLEISESDLTYNKNNNSFDYSRIKHIKETDGKVKISYFKPDIYFQINVNSAFSFQSVKNTHLPKLQEIFAQGRPFNRTNQWFGAETNEIFSFGPNVNSLTFDNSGYDFDKNGRLNIGNYGSEILPYSNHIFKSGLLQSNNLNLAISNIKHTIELNIRKKSQENLFDAKKTNLTQFALNYNFKKKIFAFFKSVNDIDNQPNINGFHNNLLFANYITPTTFENSQGHIFNSGTQRSFSPNNFNNPLWLLHLNQNRRVSTSTIYGFQSNFSLFEKFSLKTNVDFNKGKTDFTFALPINTHGFKNGYRSKKQISESTYNSYLEINYDHDIEKFASIEHKSIVKYQHNTIDYQLLKQQDFTDRTFNNPVNQTLAKRHLKNNVVRASQELRFDFKTSFDLNLALKNNMIVSSLQGKEFFLPSLQAFIDLRSFLDHPHWMNNFSMAVGMSKEAKEMPLYYNNLSHNSLVISPSESFSLLADNDLFSSKELEFETGTNFDIEGNVRLFENAVSIGINYYISTSYNTIFPVYTHDSFKLQNLASVKNIGMEASLEFNIGHYWNSFQYRPTILFSKNKSKVLKLADNRTSIPIAGFTNVSKSLVVGEKGGTIIGSAYLRDSNGSIIIGNGGYPLVDSKTRIIGNTTPLFNMSFNNEFKIGKLKCHFLIDYQHGGDIWNGTKNVLNYFGRSQESADQRSIENFVFDGVHLTGGANSTAVDFANPNEDVHFNRWVRYGFDGVAEEAIDDGTYINLRSVSISYDFAKNNDPGFFRQLEVSLFANNLLTYTKEQGISPYSSLFDHTSANGLAFFNAPITQEIGLKINLKI